MAEQRYHIGFGEDPDGITRAGVIYGDYSDNCMVCELTALRQRVAELERERDEPREGVICGRCKGEPTGFIFCSEDECPLNILFEGFVPQALAEAKLTAARQALLVLRRIGDWPRDSEGRLYPVDAEHMRRLAREAFLGLPNEAIAILDQPTGQAGGEAGAENG